jgi:hypothetical protein
MNKKFEYVDDNPGSYFGMLVESLNESNNYNSEVKDYNIYAIKKDGSSTLVKTIHGTIRDVEDEINSKFSHLPKLSFIKRIEVRDNNTGEKVYDESLKESKSGSKEIAKEIAKQFGANPKIVSTKLGYYRIPVEMLLGDFIEKAKDNGFINSGNKNIFYKDMQGVTVFVEFDEKNSAIYIDFEYEKDESLKEDKFVPQDKMSKKAQKELNDKKRGTWGNTNPVTRVQPNKKAYDRKRDKKVVDESFDNDVNVLVNLLSDKYCDEDGNVTKDSYDSVYKYLGKKYSEKIRDAVMDNLVTEFGLPAERDKEVKLDEAKKGSKVYIAIGLEKGKEPKILGVYDSKEKANEQYKDSKMWVNISEQTVK